MFDWLRGKPKQTQEQKDNREIFRAAFVQGVAMKLVEESLGNGRRRR